MDRMIATEASLRGEVGHPSADGHQIIAGLDLARGVLLVTVGLIAFMLTWASRPRASCCFSTWYLRVRDPPQARRALRLVNMPIRFALFMVLMVVGPAPGANRREETAPAARRRAVRVSGARGFGSSPVSVHPVVGILRWMSDFMFAPLFFVAFDRRDGRRAAIHVADRLARHRVGDRLLWSSGSVRLNWRTRIGVRPADLFRRRACGSGRFPWRPISSCSPWARWWPPVDGTFTMRW